MNLSAKVNVLSSSISVVCNLVELVYHDSGLVKISCSEALALSEAMTVVRVLFDDLAKSAQNAVSQEDRDLIKRFYLHLYYVDYNDQDTDTRIRDLHRDACAVHSAVHNLWKLYY